MSKASEALNDWKNDWRDEHYNNGFRYFVLKSEDFFNSITGEQAFWFNELLKQYNEYRASKGKPINKYWLVNRDESYANEVKEIIEKNEGIKLKE